MSDLAPADSSPQDIEGAFIVDPGTSPPARRSGIVLNAFATRGGGSAARLDEVARRAGRAWAAQVVLVHNPEAVGIPGIPAVTLAPPLSRLGPWTRRLLEPRLVGQAVRDYAATAVIHYGSYVPIRRVPGVRNVLFFVNLAPWDPGAGRRTFRNRALRTLFEATVARADLVIVQSDATLGFLRDQYPDLRVRIETVRNGCATPELVRTAAPRDFVAVGHVYRYRRLESVIRAYAALSAGIREAHDLVVIGHLGRDDEAVDLIRREIDRLQLDDSVRLLGPLPRDAVLRKVVDACAFVSFAAVDNGPNAVAEAAALGVPMILSDIDVHHELAAESARHVSDEAALTAAMSSAAMSVASGGRPEPRRAVDTWDRHVAEVGALLRELGALP